MRNLPETSDPVPVQPQRPQEVATERVHVAVDVSNLWRSCREAFGQSARVNYAGLLDRIKQDVYPGLSREIRAVAYTVLAPHRKVTSSGKIKEALPRPEKFQESLQRFGYEVKIRQMRYEKGITKPFHTDWDVGIAVDTMEALGTFDTLVIVSGDGDYLPLIQTVQERGRRVEVYTFQRTASQCLFSAANHLFFLSEGDIYLEKCD